MGAHRSGFWRAFRGQFRLADIPESPYQKETGPKLKQVPGAIRYSVLPFRVPLLHQTLRLFQGSIQIKVLGLGHGFRFSNHFRR